MSYRVFASMFIPGQLRTWERIVSQPLSKEEATRTAAAVRYLNTFSKKALNGFPNYLVGAEVVGEGELRVAARAVWITEAAVDDFVRQWHEDLQARALQPTQLPRAS